MRDGALPVTTYVPASELIGDAWPHWLGTAPNMDFLDIIGVARVGVARSHVDGFPCGATFDVAILDQVKLELPCLPGFELHTGSSGTVTDFTLEVDVRGHFIVRIDDVPLTLHLPPSILQRWVYDTAAQKWQPDLDAQTSEPKGFEFTLTSGIEIDFDDESISLDTPAIQIPSDTQGRTVGAMVGSTGVIVTMTGLHLVLQDAAPAGSPYPTWVQPGFRGIAFDGATVTYAKEGSELHPSGTAILTDCAIGTGGFTGTVEFDLPVSSPVVPSALPGGKLFGIDCRLESFSVTFAASVPIASSIEAYLQIPFFSDSTAPDTWLAVEASIGGQSGDLLLRLSNANQASSLVTLDRPNFAKLDIESLAFRADDGIAGVELTGKLTPQIPGLTWPAFDLAGLRIDADGHVTLPGGMLTLTKAAHLDLHGFSVELSAIGFGVYDAGGIERQYFGFSGGIRLSSDLAGAHVRNLRVSWPTSDASAIAITCDGIGVEVEVPGVMKLSGSVDFGGSKFSGAALLTLQKPFEANLGVVFVVGHVAATATARAYKFWFLDALLDLPVGIPIAQTGMAVYGGELLAGKNWTPNRQPDQGWFEDWYLSSPKGLGLSPTTATQSSTKWTDRDRSWVFGAGVVMATSSDKGHTFATKALVVVSLPGPIVFIEGRAQFLDDLTNLTNGDPPFRAVAILDFEHEEFLLGVSAHYAKSNVIDIAATSEAYFNLRDPGAWHLYIGQDPPESKRVQALVLSIVHANAFFMLDAGRLHTGASVSWGYSARVGPLSAGFQVAFDEYVDIFWHPVQLAGSVRLSGNVHLSAFGVGLSLTVDAGLSAQAPTPLKIAGSVHVALRLPWPLKSLSGDVGFSWERSATPDYWVDPFDSVSLVHPLASVTTAWTPTATASTAPTVPLDAHPVLSFGRPLNPGTSVAGVPSATSIAKAGTLGFEGELLPGVSGRFVSRLTSFALERLDASGSNWEMVSQSATPLAPWNGQVNIQSAAWGTWLNLKDRNGDWAPLQFELWNRYAFSRTADLGSIYQSQSLLQLGMNLCDSGSTPTVHCTDFTDQPAGRLLGPVFRHDPGVFVVSRTAGIAVCTSTATPRVLFLQPGTVVDLTLDGRAATLDLHLSAAPGPVTVTPREGSITGAAKAVTGDVVVRLTAATALGITGVRIAVPGTTSGAYTNDAVITISSDDESPTTAPAKPQEAPDCICWVEDLLVALAQNAEARAISSIRAQLKRCMTAREECQNQRRELEVAITREDDVGGAAGRLMECLLEHEAAGVEARCAEQLTAVRRLLKREVAAFTRIAARQPAGAKAVASLVELVATARTARAALSTCAEPHTDATSVVVAVGDADDTERWLGQIPGLATGGAAAGCSVQKICWQTVDEAALDSVSQEMTSRSDHLMGQFDADLPLFRPNSTYRLSVTTEQENSSIAATPRSWPHVSYFKTAGPPGAFVAGDSLDRLEPYLATSIPNDGAVDVFRTYDLGVVFNQPYVNGMYANQGVTLELHLLGPDGTPAKDVANQSIVLSNNWSPSETTTLQSYQQILGLVLDSSNCQIPAVEYQHDSMTSSALPSGVELEPNTRYVVDVRAGAVGATRSTLQYSFRTGAHSDFASMIEAARTTGLIFTVPASGATPASAIMTAALGSLGSVGTYDRDADDLKFRAAVSALSRAPLTPVPSSRASLLSDGTNAPLILFEFDQSVDLRRLGVRLYLDAPSTTLPAQPGFALAQSLELRTDVIVPQILRSGDGRGILLATPSHTDLSAQRVSISFTHSAAVIDATAFPNQPHLLRGGVDIDESAAVEIIFNAPTTGSGQ